MADGFLPVSRKQRRQIKAPSLSSIGSLDVSSLSLSNGDETLSHLPENALVITIGPPACGKTTWLKRRGISDVTLDDQPGVHVAIDRIEYLLASRYTKGKRLALEEREIINRLNRTMFHEKSVLERLATPKEVELTAIIMRLQNKITASRLKSLLPPTPVSNLLCAAVEDYIQSHASSTPIRLCRTLDLFVVESLFRGGMLDRATQALHNHTESSRVAWGNTNTLPRDYACALEMASQQQRPVFFCICEPFDASYTEKTSNTTPGDSNGNKSVYDLRVESFKVLLTRSIDRLVRTGRYVPAQVIYDMNERWKGTLLQVKAALQLEVELEEAEAGDVIDVALEPNDAIMNKPFVQLGRVSQFDLHRHLAQLAGYDMDRHRRVKAINKAGINGEQSTHRTASGRKFDQLKAKSASARSVTPRKVNGVNVVDSHATTRKGPPQVSILQNTSRIKLAPNKK
ncbi:hypothetical protein MPSEU_001058100 [Mayamaea pseudoterrestris]|nr:hypothetical protein MPSEU_001058100 [Mayamaea pseudoterrestris]